MRTGRVVHLQHLTITDARGLPSLPVRRLPSFGFGFRLEGAVNQCGDYQRRRGEHLLEPQPWVATGENASQLRPIRQNSSLATSSYPIQEEVPTFIKDLVLDESIPLCTIRFICCM
jgi:hypothetical protein